MTDECDESLGQALRRLDVPDHGPGFYPRLLARLEEEAARRPGSARRPRWTGSPLVGPVASSSRLRRFALVGVAAAIVIVVGSLGLRPWRVGTTADATPSCRDNFAERGQPGDADELRYLPDEIPAGFHLRGAWAGVERPCKPRDSRPPPSR